MEGVEVLEIVQPGILATIQDQGRYGYGRFGVAPSGALDGFAARVANLMVDNPEGEAVIEITLTGFKARTLTDCVVAVAGADLGLHRNAEPMPAWRSHGLQKGDLLSFEAHRNGCRAYMAIGGGVDVPEILGSRSTNLTSGFGGLEGRPLRPGDVLGAQAPEHHLAAAGRHVDLNQVAYYRNLQEVRVVAGPQFDQFSENGRNTFFNTWYRVSPHTDRTGIRLEGQPVERLPDAAESIVSEGLIAGSVQIPGDGRPIILLGETVSGGYRKIATVISADLPMLGQLMSGDLIRFQAVSVSEARRALWRREEVIARLRNRLG